MPSESQGTRIPHDRVHHLLCPLGPECLLHCLLHFNLSQQAYSVLKRELGAECTLSELAGHAADFEEIRGIGPSHSGELARVLRAGCYEQGISEAAALREVLVSVAAELDENGRIGRAVSKGLDMGADLARVACLRKIEDAIKPVTDQVASDRME